MPKRNQRGHIKIGPWNLPERSVNHLRFISEKQNCSMTSVMVEALENHEIESKCTVTYNLIKKPFDSLALGTRFAYNEDISRIYVKISHNTAAEWDDAQIIDYWIGQHVFSAFESDDELKTEVLIHS
jgi:hypothetical protein